MDIGLDKEKQSALEALREEVLPTPIVGYTREYFSDAYQSNKHIPLLEGDKLVGYVLFRLCTFEDNEGYAAKGLELQRRLVNGEDAADLIKEFNDGHKFNLPIDRLELLSQNVPNTEDRFCQIWEFCVRGRYQEEGYGMLLNEVVERTKAGIFTVHDEIETDAYNIIHEKGIANVDPAEISFQHDAMRKIVEPRVMYGPVMSNKGPDYHNILMVKESGQ